MKGHLVAIALTLLGAGSALAADLPTSKGPPPAAPAPTWNWGGLYLGVNGGYGWSDTSWNFPVGSFYTTAPGQGFSTDPTGGLLGGQVGYNAQFGSIVVGVEGSADWADLSQTRVGPVTPAFAADTYKTKVTDIEALTGRLGFADANWLFYGKGGVATAGESFSALSGLPISGVSLTKSFRLWGPTLGGGVEYMLTRNIVVGAEYDYSYFDRGGFTDRAVCTGAGNCTPIGGSTPVTIGSSHLDVQSALASISYKF
jgi:outer membrane immunogenic protein